MLIVNTEMRMTAGQVLAHPWLQGCKATPTFSISAKIPKQYKTFSKLKKAALFCIVSLCDHKEFESLKELFVFYDKEGKGCININQFVFDLSSNPLFSGENLDFVQGMDLNNNGTLEYTEFLTGFCDKKLLITQERLLLVFQIFDKNQNSKISAADLQKVFGLKKKSIFEEILKENNSDPSIGLSFEEFASIVR